MNPSLKIFPQRKLLAKMAPLVNFTKCKEDNTNSTNLLKKIETEGKHPNSFYEVSIILIPKPDKDVIKKKNYRPISLMKTHKCLRHKLISNKELISRIYSNCTSH